MRKSVVIVWIGLLAASAAAQTLDGPTGGLPAGWGGRTSRAAQHLKAKAIASHTSIAPGERFHVALELRIDDEWVYYSPDPGPTVIGGSVDVSAGGWRAGEPRWPEDKPKTVDLGDKTIVNNVYTGRVWIFVPFEAPADADAGQSIVLAPQGQICEAVCIDIDGVSASTRVEVGESFPNPAWTDEMTAAMEQAVTARELRARGGESRFPAADVPSQDARQLGLWAGLGLALLAGLTLNIMPCVLPVIPLRILSLTEMGRGSRRRYVTLGLSFCAGILLFFVALAVLSGVLRAATGAALNVSDHFQYPAVRIALAMVLIVLAVNLFGVFNVVVPGKVAGLETATGRGGHAKSVGMGLMMAVLATPCSFAYLLTAMAWAQVQPLWLGTAAILAIGAGMAAPHALLAAFPGLLKRMPKPGRWMELFKQAMGFALLPVAIWLISTLGEGGWAWWIAAYGVVLAFCIWMGATWVRYDAPRRRKLLARGSALLIAVVAGWWMLTPPEPAIVEWEDFDAGRIAAAPDAERPTLVKVTASWCTECQVIDYRVYRDPEVAAALDAADVTPIKADVSNRNSAASGWVKEIGGAPPLTILYRPGREPIRLVGGYDSERLLDLLRPWMDDGGA
jgi:thiol:disulfide interchange protein